MTGTQDNEDRPSTKPAAREKPKVNNPTPEDIKVEFDMAWVRHMTGKNRGENRTYRQFDAILDDRIATGDSLIALDKEY